MCQRKMTPEEPIGNASGVAWQSCSDPRCIDSTQKLWFFYLTNPDLDDFVSGECPNIPEDLWNKHCEQYTAIKKTIYHLNMRRVYISRLKT